MAIDAAAADALKGGFGPVPIHLRDTHYKGASKLGSGEGYKYPHDFPGHYVKQEYMPPEVRGKKYYLPSDQGHEEKIQKAKSLRDKECKP
jgi:putative ATPase